MVEKGKGTGTIDFLIEHILIDDSVTVESLSRH